MHEVEADRPPTDEELLDAVLAVVRAETLRQLHGLQPSVAVGALEGDAIRAASLTMLLLVRRKRETGVRA
jgi:hypothetical protein